jgi:hypothetical protein
MPMRQTHPSIRSFGSSGSLAFEDPMQKGFLGLLPTCPHLGRKLQREELSVSWGRKFWGSPAKALFGISLHDIPVSRAQFGRPAPSLSRRKSPLSILTLSSSERGRVWPLPHKCQLYQAPDHCRKIERSTMVRYEIGVIRSRPCCMLCPAAVSLHTSRHGPCLVRG